MKLLKALKKSAYAIYSRYFSRATLVEGTLKDSDASCRCLFIDDSSFKDYLISRMYDESSGSVRTGRLWVSSLKRLVKNPPSDVDLCIAVLPIRWEKAFNGLYDFKSPEHVRQVINLAGDWVAVKKQFHRKKREIFNRLMINSPFGCRISTDMADFDFFYYRMHLPHCRKQFGTFAGIDSYEEMKKFFLQGFLLLAVDGGKAIAGSLCLVEDHTMIYRRAGVLNGDEEYIKKGVQTALFFFMIRHAKDHNLLRLDVMQSRPFFNDGVYRHKREWGSSVSVDTDVERWIYLFNFDGSGRLATFVRQNPIIVDTPEGLMGLIGIDGTTGFSDKEREDLAKRYHSPGLEGLILLDSAEGSQSRFIFDSRILSKA
jgi:hypothetical protein